MADAAAEARIRDLKRRLELEPGSRLFVALAEELRKAGRLSQALSTLQEGLLAHPNYLSAQVALGRAYLESGQMSEAIVTFSKVLAADPGNLVSAKSLADIYLSRGESVEAIKKYKLYRALSGDRGVEDVIERLEQELAPPPPFSAEDVPPPPPSPFFEERPAGPFRISREARFPERVPAAPAQEPFDMTPVAFEPEESLPAEPAEPFPVFSRDVPLVPRASPPPLPPVLAQEDVATRALRMKEIVKPAPEAASAPVPQGRTLADLYYAQGHFAEALEIYDELVAANPFDEELRRLRRDAEARLLPAGSTPGAAAPDLALERRLAKIRAFKRWLSVVQTG